MCPPRGGLHNWHLGEVRRFVLSSPRRDKFRLNLLDRGIIMGCTTPFPPGKQLFGVTNAGLGTAVAVDLRREPLYGKASRKFDVAVWSSMPLSL